MTLISVTLIYVTLISLTLSDGGVKQPPLQKTPFPCRLVDQLTTQTLCKTGGQVAQRSLCQVSGNAPSSVTVSFNLICGDNILLSGLQTFPYF